VKAKLNARWLIPMGALGALTISAMGHAGGAARVTSVGTFGTKYHGGAGEIAFMLNIDNPTGATIPAAAKWVWQLFPLQPTVSAPQPWAEFATPKDFNIKPGSSLVDVLPAQAVPVCGRATASVVLMSNAGSVDTTTRTTQVHMSNCGYSAQFVDPTNNEEPDRVQSSEQGHVWLNSAGMTRPVVCELPQKMQFVFNLVNWAGRAGVVPLQILDPDGKTVLASERVEVKKDVPTAAIIDALRPSRPGTLAIRFVGAGRGELPVADMGWSFNFTGVCDVSVDPLK
jgi:hypothetical protein